MSRDRFLPIDSFLHFCDNTDRIPSGQDGYHLPFPTVLTTSFKSFPHYGHEERGGKANNEVGTAATFYRPH